MIRNILRRFLAREDGNIGILVGLVVLPMALMMSSTIDLGVVHTKRAEYGAAADAAVLAGINVGRLMADRLSEAEVTAMMKTTVENHFMASSGSAGANPNLAYTVETSFARNKLRATLEYRAGHKALFMPDLPDGKIEYDGRAVAEGSVADSIDVHIMVDASGSMGIGATSADQTMMYDSFGCAFACHTNGNDSYQKTKDIGAKTRIDVARMALQSAIRRIRTEVVYEGQVRFSLHLFSNDLDTIFEIDDAGSSDLDFVEEQFRTKIELHRVGTGSNMHHSLEQFIDKLRANRSSRGSRRRLEYLFIVTDGVENPHYHSASTGWRYAPNWTRNTPFMTNSRPIDQMQALNPSECDQVKNENIEIGVLYTPYIIPPTYQWRGHLLDMNRFGFIRNTLFPIMEPSLRDCASDPASYYRADSPQEIGEAVRDFFVSAIVPTHISE